MRKVVIIFLVFLITNSLVGCSSRSEDDYRKVIYSPPKDKLEIQTTIYPIYYLTSRIAGDKSNVNSFIPVGVDPHSWEPKPSDLLKLEKTDLLIYNGADLETWIVELNKVIENNKLITINATEGIELLDNIDHGHNHGILNFIKKLFGRGHSCSHGQYDPHVWLDPLKAKEMAFNIKKALIEADPGNISLYEENFFQLVNELAQLDQTYIEELAATSKKEIIVTHAAFGYLTERYGLKQIPLMGTNLHAEPTPRRLAEVVELAGEYGIHYVFTETLVNPKVAEALAREANLKTATLNPLENLTQEDIDKGKDYFTIMYENLEALKMALN